MSRAPSHRHRHLPASWLVRALALVLTSTCATAFAGQRAPESGRPRIGLALGGGGGRGFAHIGVLEWLEANRIPVDVIAGTSMGGLVAGAWATGMSPAELREMMRTADWDNMFLADSPYAFKTFRRKEDARAFPAQVHLGLKKGIHLPEGLSPGQRVQWMLNHIALPYGTLASFDDLPTPFRCVATDLTKSEVVVLDRGSLATAMRATMAIPGVFAPVALGDRLLVDGGTLNNLPADVVRAMGADVVIAVDVSADRDTQAPARGVTMFDVLGRTIDTMMLAGTRVSLKTADLILDPDLSTLSATDWRRSDEFADRGRDAAIAKADDLRRYALDETAWKAFVAARAARMAPRRPTIDILEVSGVDQDDRDVITQALDIPLGAPLDVEALELALTYLTGNDRYDTVGYRVERRGDQRVLILDVVPKSYAPPFLYLAFDLQNLDATNFSANGRLRVVFLDVLTAGSELRTDLSLGSNLSAGAELFVLVGRSRRFGTFGGSRVFVAPRVAFSQTQRKGYLDGDLVAEYRIKRTGAGLDVGFTSGRKSELRIGYDIADIRANLRVGPPGLPEGRGIDRYASVRYTFDGLTSPLVPTRGLSARASLRRYFSSAQFTSETPLGTSIADEERFWQGEASLTQFFRVRAADRLFVSMSGGSSFGKQPVINNFRLGGPFRLGSKSLDKVSGPNYGLGYAGYLRQVGRLPDVVGGSILVGGWVESGTAFVLLDDARMYTSLSGGIVFETLLGPLFGSVSAGVGGGLKFYIALGPLFR